MNIKLKKINKYYYDQGKSTKALENISLEFDTDGSFVVITGESGAGKSSLIKVITGLEDFDEGEMYFDGVPVSGLSAKKKQSIYANNISFVFQDYNLIESISAIQNVILALLKQGKTKREAKVLAKRALADVGIVKQGKMRVSKLSGGERQRVAIARSIALDTPIIVFDEPTGNLDDKTSNQITQIISKISKNKLILYVTHDYHIVRKYVTRHIVLADSNIVKDEKVRTPMESSIKQKTRESVQKLSLNSYLYSTYLIGFKHLGRTIATFIVLLFCFASIFGNLYVFATSVNAIGTIGELFTLDYDYLFDQEYQMGNEIKNSKARIDDQDVNYEGDYYIDYGDILDDDIRIYSPLVQSDSEYSSDNDSNKKTSAFDSLTIRAIPYFIDNSTLIKSENSEGVAIYIPDSWNENGYYYEILNTIYNTDITITNDTWLDIVNSSIDLTNDSQVSDPEQFETRITSIYTYDSQQNESYYMYIQMSEEQLNSLRNSFIHEFDNLSFDEATNYIGSISDLLTLKNEDGYRLARNNYLPFLDNEQIDGNHLLLSENLSGQDLTITYKNIEIPLDKFEVDYVLPYDNKYAIFDQGVKKVLAENKLISTVYFSDIETAKSNYENLKASNESMYYAEPTDSGSNYTIKLDSKSSILRQSYLFFFCFILINILIMSIIIKFIINRFYYRKSYDEQVLSYIGFSFKNIVLVNLIQFILLAIVGIATIAALTAIYIPFAAELFSANIWLLILAIVFCLMCAVFFSLPTRKKVIEND